MAVVSNAVMWFITILLQCNQMAIGGDVLQYNVKNLDRIKQIFPGLYDNRFQHELDILRNISESTRHQLLHVNITLVNMTSNSAAQFLFVAVDPIFKESPSKRFFTIHTFNIIDQILVRVGSADIVTGNGSSNICDMFWKATDSGSFHNAQVVPCSVQGTDDQYIVNTWFELTGRMFSVDERWTMSPDHKPLPGPTSPFHFIKQPLQKPTTL